MNQDKVFFNKKLLPKNWERRRYLIYPFNEPSKNKLENVLPANSRRKLKRQKAINLSTK
jgi:hypothetical protein